MKRRTHERNETVATLRYISPSYVPFHRPLPGSGEPSVLIVPARVAVVPCGLALYYPDYLGYANRYPEGYLVGDQTHRARVWAGYDLPTFVGNFNLSLLQTFYSGQAYSAIGAINAQTFPGAPARCTDTVTTNCLNYTLSQIGTAANYYFSDRGEFRTDDWNATDLALNYTLPIFGKFQFFAQAELLNAFGNDAIIDLSGNRIDTTVRTARTHPTGTPTATNPTNGSGLTQFNPFTTTPIECPQGANGLTCLSMGAHYQLANEFGTAASLDAYQTPRTYRFSAGIRF